MAEPRRKQGAGEDRPLQDVSAARGPSDDGGAGLASPEDPEKRVEELEQRLVEAEGERDQRLDDLRRLAADFDNFRKRAVRDQENLVARAHERLMKALLPVLDDIERALVAAGEHEEARLHEGVELVARELREAVKREGLQEIETEGRFDPHVHEALLSQPSEQEEGTVIEVLQKGYRLGDRVLRPARVVISQGVGPEAEPE
jgi:molecular chaperone GrpE